MKDTPRTNFVAHATGDVEWDRSINRFGRMMAHACILERELAAQKEQYADHMRDLERELAAQKEQFRCIRWQLLLCRQMGIPYLTSCFVCAGERQKLLKECGKREVAMAAVEAKLKEKNT